MSRADLDRLIMIQNAREELASLWVIHHANKRKRRLKRDRSGN